MRYEDFESKKEYLIHVKTVFYKNGVKCMVLSVAVLLLMFAIGAEAVKTLTSIPKNIFWIFQKLITGYFVIGAVSYLFSFLRIYITTKAAIARKTTTTHMRITAKMLLSSSTDFSLTFIKSSSS